MNAEFQKYLNEITHAKACEEVETIQSLWSGYGKISRYRLYGSELQTVVVKHIAFHNAIAHPRGWNTDIGHQRKLRSYEVEIHWYRYWNDQCTTACRTAKYLGSLTLNDQHWIILEDLNVQFPARKERVHLAEVKSCLDWLANFHAMFINRQPLGLWEIGTYWHLATRPEELEQMNQPALRENAAQIDAVLNACAYQTIVHGDAKLANFCFSQNGENIAVVDFQYVGGGCGMKDVAYFLGSCLSNSELYAHVEHLLNFYFHSLKQALEHKQPTVDSEQLEKEWRRMFPLAWTDFTRFLLGWMPTHQKLNTYSIELMESVLYDMKNER